MVDAIYDRMGSLSLDLIHPQLEGLTDAKESVTGMMQRIIDAIDNEAISLSSTLDGEL